MHNSSDLFIILIVLSFNSYIKFVFLICRFFRSYGEPETVKTEFFINGLYYQYLIMQMEYFMTNNNIYEFITHFINKEIVKAVLLSVNN